MKTPKRAKNAPIAEMGSQTDTDAGTTLGMPSAEAGIQSALGFLKNYKQ